MAKALLTQSKSMSREYCCSVVRVGEVVPIEGSDFLAKTIVDGFQIVVRKDEVKEGDVLFYASNETELNERFLSINNQFEDHEKNANYEEYIKYKAIHDKVEEELNDFLFNGKLKTEDDLNSVIDPKRNQLKELDDKLKGMRGFFNKYGRVKMITLRKCPSMGYLFDIDAMAKFCPKVKDLDLEAIVDDPNADRDFDTVDGELFVKAYMPRVKENPATTQPAGHKRQKHADKIDRIVKNQFVFHYDTQQLNKNINRISPKDKVYISVKLHGTSAIFGNLKVRNPKDYGRGPVGKLLTYVNAKLIPSKLRKYDIVYDDIYSSRSVIKNQYLNEGASSGFYKTDIWGEYQKKLKGKIPQGMTIYGEIVGYLTDSDSMIQKNYDYGCKVGENKLMVYRVTTEESDGSKREWEIDEVAGWYTGMVSQYPELKSSLMPFPLLYEGALSNLYPSIEPDYNWNANVLEALKKEAKFGMEGNEPRCKSKVPREGIVLRIANDPLKEAFKLKCNKFLEMEGKLIDAGAADIESTMRYDA